MAQKAQSENFVFIVSHEKPLRISGRKGDIFILKRSFNLLTLSAKLAEFIYLLAVIMGINTRRDHMDSGRPVGKLELQFRRQNTYGLSTRVAVEMENNGKLRS